MSWTNGTNGRLVGCENRICLADAEEIGEALARRKLLTCADPVDYSGLIYPNARIAKAELDALRSTITGAGGILYPYAGVLGGDPVSPTSMQWLWPVSDSDQGKVIVSGEGGVEEGQVGLMQKLNGTAGWTDSAIYAGSTNVRAVHFNELRQAVEWISRGRWEMPIYFSAGIFSILPDTPWIGRLIANNGTDELHALGFAFLRIGGDPIKGLDGVTALPTSRLTFIADIDCAIEIYRCARPIDFYGQDPPTWNHYAPGSSGAWSSPGGTGGGDAELIGSLNLQQYVPKSLSGSSVAAALQAMVDGAEQNFLIRKSNADYETIALDGTVCVEFDVDDQ